MLLTLVGSYFLIKMRFFFVLHPIRTVTKAVRSIKDRRAFRSFSLALAGTLGVGNVFGVALAIMIGGAGSLFWLFVSMLFAMVIKYAEVVITSDNLYHDTDIHGGIYYVIKASFGRLGHLVSGVYSLAVLMLSLVLGAALQTDAMENSVCCIIPISPVFLAVLFVVMTLATIIGGTSKIEKITAIIIPMTTIVYIFLTSYVIFANISGIGGVVLEILRSAFRCESAIGGCVGFLFSLPMREGFARGILSNEAGAGTSAMAHARSGLLSPASAGLLGILEVWFDTGLICMLTGFSILLSVPDPETFSNGMHLVVYTVGNSLGTVGKWALVFCVFSFAFATVICWYYYGSESWSALFGKRRRTIYLPIFLVFVGLGCFADSMLLVSATDLFMLAATSVTLAALLKNSDRIRDLSELSGIISPEPGILRRLRVGKIKGSVFLRGERGR